MNVSPPKRVVRVSLSIVHLLGYQAVSIETTRVFEASHKENEMNVSPPKRVVRVAPKRRGPGSFKKTRWDTKQCPSKRREYAEQVKGN